MARVSVFRTIAEAVNTLVAELLTTEGRAVPDFRYGPDKFQSNEQDPRLRWMQLNGSIVEDPKVGATKTPTDAQPVATPLYIRRANAHIWMTHANDEDCEHLLETVMRASKRSDYARFFHWGLARYDFPSQAVGAEVQNGVSVIRLYVPIDIQVNAELDDEYQLREVTADKLRAGIVANRDDALDATDLAVSEWSG